MSDVSYMKLRQTWVQTCDLRNFRQRRGNLEGVGNCCDALCGVGSFASVGKPTQRVVRKIKLQSRRIRTQEKRW